MLLAVETSCDETAVSLVELGKGNRVIFELISSQTKLHEQYGGVVPELAAREHIVNLPILISEILKNAEVNLNDISAIAVTQGPGLKGCLLVGVSFCKSLARSLGIPLLPINHLEGHLFAGFLMPEAEQPEYPCLSLLVSGGHTQLFLMEEFRKYKLLAATKDDAAGEAFDKSATVLGLPYPGGPALSREAIKGDRTKYNLPIGMAQDLESFSFSGLKTAVQRLVKDLGEEIKNPDVKSNIAASVEWAIVRALVEKSMFYVKELMPKSFLITGGVAANRCLRETLKERLSECGIKFCVPEQKWCTDNASMIGILAKQIIDNNYKVFKNIRTSKTRQLEFAPGVSLTFGPEPRWPIQ